MCSMALRQLHIYQVHFVFTIVLLCTCHFVCICVGPTCSPFSSEFGGNETSDQRLACRGGINPQMYQSLYIPSTSNPLNCPAFNPSSGDDDESEDAQEIDEFPNIPHQPPSLPIYAGGRYAQNGFTMFVVQ